MSLLRRPSPQRCALLDAWLFWKVPLQQACCILHMSIIPKLSSLEATSAAHPGLIGTISPAGIKPAMAQVHPFPVSCCSFNFYGSAGAALKIKMAAL